MKEGWEYKKLGEVATIINGKNQKAVENVNGIYPICGSGGIMGYANDFLCPEQTVILGRKGNINRPIFMEQKFWNVDTAFGIVAKKSQLYSKFLYYFCIDFNFEKLNKAVTIPSLVKSDLLKIDMPVPPVSEQQHIVEELDLLSSIIEKKKAQLKELDNLAQSLFYEMFGDPITNENGWEVKKMGEVCNVTSSKRIFASEYCCNGVPFYRGKEITEKSKGQEISVELYISTERYEEIKKEFGIPIKGDVLITAVGTIGNIWVVNDEEPFYFKDGNIIWLKDIKGINSVYFKTILSILIAAYKQQMAQGCAYNALTIVNLKKMFFALPPIDLQNLYASKIEAIEHQKELIQKSIKEVETLFNSRMDFYFN